MADPFLLPKNHLHCITRYVTKFWKANSSITTVLGAEVTIPKIIVYYYE
ncbi:MAG: hypothetical protein II657_07385 [Clostridiales bacterium]|nr:hypothetical protein [Clostridiales bacterium]